MEQVMYCFRKWGLLVFAFMLASILCLESVDADAAAKPKLSTTKTSLNVKDTVTLKVKKVTKKKIAKVTYKSSKKSVARVSSKGKVTAKKKGTTTITCTVKMKAAKSAKLKCKVTVVPAPAYKNKAVNMAAGASLTPAMTNVITKNVKSTAYSSSNAKAASVNNKGTVTAVSAGTATIMAKMKMKSGKSYTTKCTVTVKAAPAVKPTENPTMAPTAVPQPTEEPTPRPGEHDSANGIKTIDDGVMREDFTSFDIIHEMGVGTNLGNTMEATSGLASTVQGFETAWGQPVTTQEMLTGMKKAGFNSIRIPVAWSNMMSKDGQYMIPDAFFDRIETIMNYALNEKMYVVINDHWDSGWWARFGSVDEDERAEAMVKYKTMWTQIAERFKEYSDYLIFESANEELGERLNWESDYANSGWFQSEDELYDCVNQINQTFVDVVRGTGGNNAKRHLLIAGYDTNIAKTCDDRYKMPKDTIENRLIVSVHYYSPSTYCIVDQEDNSWGYAASWGTEAEIAELQATLRNMKIRFCDNGYPVIIGEYGVTDTKKEDGTYVRKEGRDVFFNAVCEYALENGMCPMLWDTNQIFNRKTCQITNATERANYLALSKKAEELPVYAPVGTDGNYKWVGTIGSYSWRPTTPQIEDGSTFLLNHLGNCYQVIGVDWTKFENPVVRVQLEAGGATGAYRFADTVVRDKPTDDPYIEMERISWDTTEDLILDLVELGLNMTEGKYLYLDFSAGKSYSGKAVITIYEKESTGPSTAQ